MEKLPTSIRSLIILFGIGLSFLHSVLFAEEISRMRPMLGTFASVTVEGIDPASAHYAIEKAFEAIQEVDRLLSSHRPESELNQINRVAGDRAILISPWTYECIKAGVEIGHQSEGAFDITCRPVLDLWGFIWKKNYRLPTRENLQEALALVDYRQVILFEESRSKSLGKAGSYRVGLARPKMTLDVGGIGKGFAVDKAVEALVENGVPAGLVRIGGDLRGFGPKKWKVGIADPTRSERATQELFIQNEAVSTAGDYENFFELNGKRYSHIIDPRTGWPVRQRHSVSVKAPTCTLSDGWSTALFVNPKACAPSTIRVIDIR